MLKGSSVFSSDNSKRKAAVPSRELLLRTAVDAGELLEAIVAREKSIIEKLGELYAITPAETMTDSIRNTELIKNSIKEIGVSLENGLNGNLNKIQKLVNIAEDAKSELKTDY